MKNTPKNIAIEKLFPFEGHPFKVQDNEEMNALIESIQEQGILSPLIVRPKENTEDEYEIVSGHRRFRAAVKAGISAYSLSNVPNMPKENFGLMKITTLWSMRIGKNRDTSGIFFPVSHRDTDLLETPNFSANSICVKPFALRFSAMKLPIFSWSIAVTPFNENIARASTNVKDTKREL